MHELSQDDQEKLISALFSALETAPGEPAPQRIETHISNVILVGDFAYKIKKPVDFGFLDFRTLARRRHFCAEEIRLNGRLAPQIYLDVIPITGTLAAPILGSDTAGGTSSDKSSGESSDEYDTKSGNKDGETDADAEPLEFAVRMRRFSQDGLLSKLAETRALPLETMDDLAGQIADFHAQAARATPDSEFSTPEAVLLPVQENFEQIRPLLADPAALGQLERLERWSLDQYSALRDALAERGRSGWVRECHGDMHLGNMALIDDRVLIFDGIEFNERMRWTDVLGDVAFLAMDLDDRGLPAHGNRFLNAWLERSGDYSALALLNFYRVYRAMVRAKIAALRLTQKLDVEEHAQVLDEYQGYTDLAERYTQTAQPMLCITHGLSGSGKSTIAGQLVERYGMLRIRSDVERKRLYGLGADADSGATLGGGIYSADATEATYDRLAAIADVIVRAGYSVVVDAAFLKAWQRNIFSELARRRHIPFTIFDIDVPIPTIKRWLARRRKLGGDPSEATLAVLEKQLANREALAGDELRARCPVDAAADPETALQDFHPPGIGVNFSHE